MVQEPDIAPEPETEDDDAYALSPRTIAAILEAVEAGARETLVALMEPLHAADIADMLEQIDAADRAALIRLYDREFDGEILTELDEGIREEVIRILKPEVLAEAVRELDSDDVVDLLEDLEAEQRDSILGALTDRDRLAIEQSLEFPDYSAGRLMQREVVMAPEHWTVGEAIDYMRATEDLPDQFYHVILVDPRMKPVGKVALGKLMSSPRPVKLSDITDASFHVIPVTRPEADVAYAFNQYHLISAPVVDENERLVGVITIDDAMMVLDEEHEEDILRLAGVGEESSLSDTALETTRQRFPWLAVNLATAILASLVIAQFEAAIAQITALAVLMPIVASMGGNAGTQSLTVAVRALATRDLTGSNAWRVIRREAAVGLIMGVAFAVVMGIVGLIWFGSTTLGWVIFAAMIINMLAAALAGIGIPIVLEKLRVDPALASGTFVTTVTDVVGFFAFLGLASAVLL
ncbi:magnesium transporter [Roseivivax lentus]|uniref:Magnesium transporter MgtE n=1 Tax=Roseivivax lentus TaxID=633194 RepID=A0A1N7LE56_9RHOB|nr:magnesium transporter [Roseivivax lentus]SIS72098.1 magnesium transporter [Roseivivax lentus]